MRVQSDLPMKLVTHCGTQDLICFNEEEVYIGEGDEKVMKYEYDAVRIKFPYQKNELISAIITEQYPHDKMEAIMNNKLAGLVDEKHEKEFVAMQEWRANAKEIAKQVFDKLSEEQA